MTLHEPGHDIAFSEDETAPDPLPTIPDELTAEMTGADIAFVLKDLRFRGNFKFNRGSEFTMNASSHPSQISVKRPSYCFDLHLDDPNVNCAA